MSNYVNKPPLKGGVFEMNEVIQSLMNHRSVRKYQDKPVEPAL